MIANLFIGAAARRMLPELIGVAREWSADLIIRESLEFAGCVAAEALGLPHASVAAAADSALDRRRELAGPLTGLRQQAGLPADPDGDMAFRYLHLCFTPPGFDGPGARFPPTARFFAHHSTATPHEDGGFNSVKEALAEGVPLVVVPIAGDQPYCARRCEALGVGRVIGPAERNAAVIRAAVRTVLGDPSYRDHARHMRDEICALPPAAAAVTALEQVADKYARH